VIPLVLHLAFFASGAAALIYEVVWMRRLSVVLGATAPATAATLAALFLGMGIGNALFGGLAARLRRPLVSFAFLEAGIAVAALGVDPLLSRVALPFVAPDVLAGGWLLAARMAVATAVLVPPAILMGGSLPLLAQALDRGAARLGALGGGLYAVNTLGAAAGGLAVPTLLLPALGGSGTVWVAAGLNLAVAALAAIAAQALPGGAPAVHAAPSTPAARAVSPARTAAAAPAARPTPGVNAWPAGWLLAAAFLSGAVSLALEVLWTRMLALVHENSVYSFATVVALFLAGLAAGAAISRALVARGRPAHAIAGGAWIGSGVLVIAAPALFGALTSGLEYLGGAGGLLWHEMKLAGLAVVVLFPATVLTGSALPALMEMAGAGRARSAGAALGRLLSANTLGSIAGSLLALFLLGPALGLWWSIVLCGLLLLVAGEAALAGRPTLERLPARVAFYAALAVIVGVLRPGDLPRVRLETGDRLVGLREGALGTVAVVEEGGDLRMMLNNHYAIGGTASTGEERLQAHLPLFLHPEARTVAFLGLGTGITAGAALLHPVRVIVAEELVPEAVEVARIHFRAANLGVVEDARARVRVGDARTLLRASAGTFDVIVGDLVVPWRHGEAALYTEECFASARRALARGGIYCQWVPLFQISRAEFDCIAATFLDVFPRTILWRGDFRAGEPAVALVGLTSDAPLDPDAIDAAVRRSAEAPDPTNPYLADPAGLWAYLAGPLSPADAAFRSAPRSRDDRPVVELASPFAPFARGDDVRLAFTGTRLKPWLDALIDAPVAGTPLERLDAAHLRWRQAGAGIWNASLLELEGRHAEADALGEASIARFPAALQRALGRTPADPAAARPAAPGPALP
jgi:spermidine synthase